MNIFNEITTMYNSMNFANKKGVSHDTPLPKA